MNETNHAPIVEEINNNLKDKYGLFVEGHPNWRVVWSTGIMEYRKTRYSAEGFELPQEVVRLLPKYDQWNKDKYILERAMPALNYRTDWPNDVKWAYEPVWTFEDGKGNFLPPNLEVAIIVIDAVYNESAKRVGVKYKPEFQHASENIEERSAEIDRLVEEAFGNETSLSDALAQDSAVGYGVRQRNDSRFKNVN